MADSHGFHAPARDRQLDPVAPSAPSDIVKALVDQKQAPASGGTMVRGHLPDQPEGTLNSAHPQAFGGISVVAMAHAIQQGFMEAQFQFRLELPAGHWFEEQLHQWSQLESGWRNEV